MANIISEIGSHPADWSIQRVDSLFNIQQGKSVSKAHREGNNQKPFLRTKNVFWGKIDFSELDHMHFTEQEETRLTLQAGDLLLCEGGDVGRTAIWNNQMEGCYHQNHLHRLRAKAANEIDPQFALYWFWYAFEIANLYIGRSNVTTILNLSQSKLSELQIPKPEIDEQRRIAHILTTVQTAIEQQSRLIELTRELKSALMGKLFTEGLRGEKQKETEIGLVPESWEVAPLGKYANIKNGYAFKSNDYVKQGVLSVRISNVSNGILINKDNQYLPEDFLTKYSDYALREGDLILSLTRPIISTGMKYCLIEKKHLPLLLNQRVGKFEIKNPDMITKDYLYYIVFSKYFIDELKKLFGNSSQQPNVSPLQLEKFLIPLPKLEEQEKISFSLATLTKKENFHTQKKQLLEELFRTLLHQLMTGEVRTTDLTGLGDLWGLLTP